MFGDESVVCCVWLAERSHDGHQDNIGSSSHRSARTVTTVWRVRASVFLEIDVLDRLRIYSHHLIRTMVTVWQVPDDLFMKLRILNSFTAVTMNVGNIWTQANSLTVELWGLPLSLSFDDISSFLFGRDVCQTRTCYLLFDLRHVTGWRDERTWPRGVAERCRGGKEKLSTLFEFM